MFLRSRTLVSALLVITSASWALAETPDPEDKAALKKYYGQRIFDLPFKVKKLEWNEDDENGYSKFVYEIGKGVATGRCGRATDCLRDPKINPYASRDPEGIIFYADCARFPYMLRAYYAYHNGLPFEHVLSIAISPRPYASAADRDSQLPTAQEQDSPYGNYIRKRGHSNLPRAAGAAPNFQRYLMGVMDEVSTRVLRVGPLTPGYELSDVYPVQINRDGIRPGTLIAANGHAMVVWNVDANGTVYFIDGHPGAYVQAHPFERSKLQRSRPDHGFGFFRFRPLRVEGGSVGPDGAIYGGKIVTAKDQDLFAAGKYSLDQWFGPGSNVAPGTKVDPSLWRTAYRDVDFFDYVDSKLRQSGSQQQADEPVALAFSALCAQMRDRKITVDGGIAAGLGQWPHPEALPQNIYSAAGDWERFATPSVDGRMKDGVRSALRTAIHQFRAAKSGSPSVVFKGGAKDYQARLRKRLAKVAKSCPITYVNSEGATVTLGFHQVLARLNRLSFDPYMCPEKLWGASDDELSTCRDLDEGSRWYNSEQAIRNTVGKQVDDQLVVRSTRPITLDMLESGTYVDQPISSDIALGTSKVPLMNLDAYLASKAFLRALKD